MRHFALVSSVMLLVFSSIGLIMAAGEVSFYGTAVKVVILEKQGIISYEKAAAFRPDWADSSIAIHLGRFVASSYINVLGLVSAVGFISAVSTCIALRQGPERGREAGGA